MLTPKDGALARELRHITAPAVASLADTLTRLRQPASIRDIKGAVVAIERVLTALRSDLPEAKTADSRNLSKEELLQTILAAVAEHDPLDSLALGAHLPRRYGLDYLEDQIKLLEGLGLLKPSGSYSVTVRGREALTVSPDRLRRFVELVGKERASPDFAPHSIHFPTLEELYVTPAEAIRALVLEQFTGARGVPLEPLMRSFSASWRVRFSESIAELERTGVICVLSHPEAAFGVVPTARCIKEAGLPRNRLSEVLNALTSKAEISQIEKAIVSTFVEARAMRGVIPEDLMEASGLDRVAVVRSLEALRIMNKAVGNPRRTLAGYAPLPVLLKEQGRAAHRFPIPESLSGADQVPGDVANFVRTEFILSRGVRTVMGDVLRANSAFGGVRGAMQEGTIRRSALGGYIPSMEWLLRQPQGSSVACKMPLHEKPVRPRDRNSADAERLRPILAKSFVESGCTKGLTIKEVANLLQIDEGVVPSIIQILFDSGDAGTSPARGRLSTGYYPSPSLLGRLYPDVAFDENSFLTTARSKTIAQLRERCISIVCRRAVGSPKLQGVTRLQIAKLVRVRPVVLGPILNSIVKSGCLVRVNEPGLQGYFPATAELKRRHPKRWFDIEAKLEQRLPAMSDEYLLKFVGDRFVQSTTEPATTPLMIAGRFGRNIQKVQRRCGQLIKAGKLLYAEHGEGKGYVPTRAVLGKTAASSPDPAVYAHERSADHLTRELCRAAAARWIASRFKSGATFATLLKSTPVLPPGKNREGHNFINNLVTKGFLVRRRPSGKGVYLPTLRAWKEHIADAEAFPGANTPLDEIKRRLGNS